MVAAQRPLALGQVSRAAVSSRALLESRSRICAGDERLHAGGGQLEREWQVVEPAADLGTAAVELEVGLHRPRPGE